MIGPPASSASTTAGCRLAAADPEVHGTAAGMPVARAVPRAKNPALRSSRITDTSISGCRQRATARGVEREPGESTAPRTPQRANSSVMAEARAVLRFVPSTSTNGSSVEPACRKGLFVDLDVEAGALIEPDLVRHRRGSASHRRGEEPFGGEAVRDACIASAVTQGRCRVSGGGDPHRPLEGARQIRRHRLRDLESRSEATYLGDLDRGHIARAELLGPASVEG